MHDDVMQSSGGTKGPELPRNGGDGIAERMRSLVLCSLLACADAFAPPGHPMASSVRRAAAARATVPISAANDLEPPKLRKRDVVISAFDGVVKRVRGQPEQEADADISTEVPPTQESPAASQPRSEKLMVASWYDSGVRLEPAAATIALASQSLAAADKAAQEEKTAEQSEAAAAAKAAEEVAAAKSAEEMAAANARLEAEAAKAAEEVEAAKERLEANIARMAATALAAEEEVAAAEAASAAAAKTVATAQAAAAVAVKPKPKKNVPTNRGIFAPAVDVAKQVMGEQELKEFRASVIAKHSKVIGQFVDTSESPFGQLVLKRMFEYADKDGNGQLDKEEVC